MPRLFSGGVVHSEVPSAAAPAYRTLFSRQTIFGPAPGPSGFAMHVPVPGGTPPFPPFPLTHRNLIIEASVRSTLASSLTFRIDNATSTSINQMTFVRHTASASLHAVANAEDQNFAILGAVPHDGGPFTEHTFAGLTLTIPQYSNLSSWRTFYGTLVCPYQNASETARYDFGGNWNTFDAITLLLLEIAGSLVPGSTCAVFGEDSIL